MKYYIFIMRLRSAAVEGNLRKVYRTLAWYNNKVTHRIGRGNIAEYSVDLHFFLLLHPNQIIEGY